MFNSKVKKDALLIHEKAVAKYNRTYAEVQNEGENLYLTRKNAVELIGRIEILINSIANSPKEFEVKLSKIATEREKFRKTEKYAEEAHTTAVRSGISMAAGVTGGAAIASLAPSAAMWVATTFGTASTGTAISALHGVAATKAALAWLGGGALTTGGGGIAAGQALLALAGPIGWGIAGAATTVSAFFLSKKNSKVANEAIEQAKKIIVAGAQLNELCAQIKHINQESQLLLNNLTTSFSAIQHMSGSDYTKLNDSDKLRLGTLVNNTLTLSALINKTIGIE